MKTSLAGPGARTWLVVLTAILFGIGGFVAGTRRSADTHNGGESHQAVSQEAAQQKYVCSMNISFHPYFSSYDVSDKCGYCGMTLIPAASEGDEAGERQLVMSPAALKLAEVETFPAERRFVDIEIPLAGKVDYDESRVKTISAWVPGRLDRLFADYTGVPVKKGDHLVEIYSPELYAAQEELLQAVKMAGATGNSQDQYVRGLAASTVEAVREKLHLLGLTDEQISTIEKQKAPSARVEIKAPIGGIVIHKNAREGMYVKTGTAIYTVADLSRLWVQLDAYESDLAWIRYGQDVDIRTAAFGDKVFRGWISFIDPILNAETRTIKVRVVVDNARGLLRPNMFVRGIVRARAGDGEVVLSSNLEGKWICPMHPEIIGEDMDKCDVCSMDLVQASSLGYVSGKAVGAPLVLPSSAVLVTGRRAVVYVRRKDTERPTFEGVEVELGPRAGDYYIIRSGIEEGADVVVNGNFKIDSALQLLAKPSMMSPGTVTQLFTNGHGDASSQPTAEKLTTKPFIVPPEFTSQLGRAVRSYYRVHKALVAGSQVDAAAAGNAVLLAVKSVDASGLSVTAAHTWHGYHQVIELSAKALSQAEEVQKQRESLPVLTDAFESALRSFGPLPGLTVRKAFCSMAFNNKGAFWLQPGEIIENPYFGDAMLRCGEIKDVLSVAEEKDERHHE